MRFKDRADAGEKLAAALEEYGQLKPLVVYALPRGGTILGAAVAKKLNAPLSLITPRKVGHPSYPEYAVAAVTEEGIVVAKPAEIMSLNEEWLQDAINRERREAKRRHDAYLSGASGVSPNGKTAIIVDDGVATGLTMLAAIYEIQRRHASRIIAAAPVIPFDTRTSMEDEADEVVALIAPRDFAGSVGAYYDEFEPVSDEEVKALLEDAAH